jgi:hypothetical protein
MRRAPPVGTLPEETRHKLCERKKTSSNSIKKVSSKNSFLLDRHTFAVKEYSH